MRKTLTRSALLGLALALAAGAQTRLTGIQLVAMDANGNFNPVFDGFSTHNTSLRFKLWVVKGEDVDGAFINGPDIANAPVNIPMTSGTHTYTLYGEGGNTTLRPFYGVSLFFNLETTAQLNVFAPLNTSSTQFFPDWSPSRGKVPTLINSTQNTADGKIEFVDGRTKVTITGFNFSAPAVFKKDRVDRWGTRKSGGFDFIGQIQIKVTAPPAVSNGGVVNAASFAPKIAPGALFSVFGTDMAAVPEARAASLPLPVDLAGTSVTVAGRPAPLVFVSPGQVNAQMPYELEEGAAPVVVTVNGVASEQRTVQIVKAAPGIFQFGDKRAVVQNADGTVNTADNGAMSGSYVVAYLTGGGAVDNPVETGRGAKASPLSRHRGTVTATIGGLPAAITFSGLTPDFVGLTQINMQIPGLQPGHHPLLVTVDGVQSNAATVTVK